MPYCDFGEEGGVEIPQNGVESGVLLNEKPVRGRQMH